MSRYRCPSCKSALTSEKVYDGRLLFICSKCEIGATLPVTENVDEAYLDFLDLHDNGKILHRTMEELLEKEGIIRSAEEIESLLEGNGSVAAADDMVRSVLSSRRDYVVDYKIMDEPEPESGSSVRSLGLLEPLAKTLEEKGIATLFRFQEEAIRKIVDGKNLVIVAPTASGKTEAFTIPVLERIASQFDFDAMRYGEPGVHAIFVYPTKALARDQIPKIKQLAEPLGIRVAVFDGDTPARERQLILDEPPHIVVTNFDVIHYHLMHRTGFARLITNIRYLIVDEAHVYTGVFGSNVHYIVKRLKRLSNAMQIIAASATLPNAKEFCEKLFDCGMDLVQGRGRRGRVHFSILFPSLRTQRSLMLELVKKLTSHSHKIISFANSHIAAELLAFYAAKQGVSIRVHRAGLMPNYRRSIEDSFKHGELMALSSTPTLELGIDIGAVDGVISSIVPINRLMQRLGRAARRGRHGYAFLALGNDPISQYYRNHPNDYLNDFEYAYTDPDNPFVQEYQVLAMACDKPLTHEESERYEEPVRKLMEKNLLTFSDKKRCVPDYREARKFLHELSIRGVGRSVDIVLKNRKVGERSLPMALEELYDGAVYFLAGARYTVTKLRLDDNNKHPKAEIARLPHDYPYYTKALTEEWPHIDSVYEIKHVHGVSASYCALHIHKRVIGYTNIEIGSDITKGRKVMLEEPLEYDFVTKGLVFRAPRALDSINSAKDPLYVEMSSYHATEHVIIEGSRMITGGASQDMGGISLGSSGMIFVYDSSVGGNGASKVLFDRLSDAFTRGKSILAECPCRSESGCPRCTYSYRCGNNNEYLHKYGAREVCTRILARERTEIMEPLEGERSLV